MHLAARQLNAIASQLRPLIRQLGGRDVGGQLVLLVGALVPRGGARIDEVAAHARRRPDAEAYVRQLVQLPQQEDVERHGERGQPGEAGRRVAGRRVHGLEEEVERRGGEEEDASAHPEHHLLSERAGFGQLQGEREDERAGVHDEQQQGRQEAARGQRPGGDVGGGALGRAGVGRPDAARAVGAAAAPHQAERDHPESEERGDGDHVGEL